MLAISEIKGRPLPLPASSTKSTWLWL